MTEQKKNLALSKGAKQLVADICAGAADGFLKKKYGLSESGLKRILAELLAAKAICQADLDQRASTAESVHEHVGGLEEETPCLPMLRLIRTAGLFRNIEGAQIFWCSCHAFSERSSASPS